MDTNIFIFFLIYFFVSLSVLGYGALVVSITKKYIKNISIGEIGILGIIFLILYSYISHLFYSHGEIHNLILLIIGIFLFFIKKNFLVDKNFKIFIFIFSLLFFGFAIFKNHDDFTYYHFPYIHYINKFPHMFGIGNFNHGFRTPSSIFYLNSLYFLPFFKYYLFNIGQILIVGFSNLILLSKITKYFKSKKYDFIFLITISLLIFINVFFYRISEHGTDRSAQILVSILFLEYLILIYYKSDYRSGLSKIFLLTSLIISLKAFYFLYSIFLVPLIIFLYFSKKSNFITEIIKLKNLFFNLLLITVLLIFFINFSNSGCMVYPVHFTCFENFIWSIPLSEVKDMNDWYEQWAKAGAGPNYEVKNAEEYIRNFNWFQNWIKIYFFNKVSDYLLGIIFICIIFTFTFYSKKKIKKIKIDKNLLIFYFFIIIIFVEWLYNHPSLRYGGYIILFYIFMLPYCIFLNRYNLDPKKIKSRSIVIIALIALIFVSRNTHRLYDEYKKYNYNPFIKFNYEVSKDNFRINNYFLQQINNYKLCIEKNKNCDQNLVKKKNFYFFYEVN